VDVHAGTAECIGTRWRQLQPKQKPLDVGPTADELLGLIVSHREDERLKWGPEGSVTLQMGRIIPGEGQFKDTVNERRKRLRNLLQMKLESFGWRRLRANTYKRE
jgi:hypothetical protein